MPKGIEYLYIQMLMRADSLLTRIARCIQAVDGLAVNPGAYLGASHAASL
jgi:hypothetical protein